MMEQCPECGVDIVTVRMGGKVKPHVPGSKACLERQVARLQGENRGFVQIVTDLQAEIDLKDCMIHAAAEAAKEKP